MTNPKKLFIKTYGCQMNVYDSLRMGDVLAPLGYAASDTPEDADLVILNTCHIREKAEEKVYSDLGRILKEKKQKAERGEKMLIAVGGCVGQADDGERGQPAAHVDLDPHLPRLQPIDRERMCSRKHRPKLLV